MAKDIDEDLIEATIRRVAESKAAREAPPIEMPVAESIAPEIEKGAEQDQTSAVADAGFDDDDAYEDDVDVTPTPLMAAARGRGVSRATTSLARAMSTTPDRDDEEPEVARKSTPLARAMSTTPDHDDEEPEVARRGTPLARAMSTTPDHDDREPEVARRGTTLARAMPATADYDDDEPEVARRDAPRARAISATPGHGDAIAGVADTEVARQLGEVTLRLDAIMALLQDLAGHQAPAVGGAWGEAQASARASAPAVLRPAIFRDTSPRPAAPEPEPEIIDTRPIPKPLPPLQVESKRGFDLLPRSYRITVEDKRRGVDLVPLHRALLSMDGVRDMSLLSYNNGVAIVALDTTEELDPDALGASVSRAMSRDARVEVHNEHTMVVKLADE